MGRVWGRERNRNREALNELIEQVGALARLQYSAMQRLERLEKVVDGIIKGFTERSPGQTEYSLASGIGAEDEGTGGKTHGDGEPLR